MEVYSIVTTENSGSQLSLKSNSVNSDIERKIIDYIYWMKTVEQVVPKQILFPIKENNVLPIFDALEIMILYSGIFRDTALTIQTRVNLFISQITHAQKTFLIFHSELKNESSIQVIGEDILPHSLTIPEKASKCLSTLATTGHLSVEQSIEMQSILQKILGILVKSYVIIPTFPYKCKNVILFVCLINKTIIKRSVYLKNNSSAASGDTRIISIRPFLLVDKHFVTDLFDTLGLIVMKKIFHTNSQYLNNFVQITQKLQPTIDSHHTLLNKIIVETGRQLNAAIYAVHLLTTINFNSTIYHNYPDGEIIKNMIIQTTDDVILDRVMSNCRPTQIFPNKCVVRYDTVMHHIICAPIMHDGVILGILEFCNKKTGLYFSSQNQDFTKLSAKFCSYILQSQLNQC